MKIYDLRTDRRVYNEDEGAVPFQLCPYNYLGQIEHDKAITFFSIEAMKHYVEYQDPAGKWVLLDMPKPRKVKDYLRQKYGNVDMWINGCYQGYAEVDGREPTPQELYKYVVSTLKDLHNNIPF